MAQNKRRSRDSFRKFERLMTRVILGLLVVFLLYLIAAANGIGWLKWLLAVPELLASAALLVLLLLLGRKYGPYRLGNRSAAFWAAIFAVALPIGIGGLAATNFDRAFVIFHSLFFPGKDNWIFDYRTDQIILVLPQDFFMHCAMLIGGGLLCFSLGLLIFALIREKKCRNPKVS